MAREQPAAHSGDGCGQPHRSRTAAADIGSRSIAGPRMRFPSQVHKEVNTMGRSLMLVIAVGWATLGSSIAWSEDSDQAAFSKALDGVKLILLQGIAQVAKGTEVPPNGQKG